MKRYSMSLSRKNQYYENDYTIKCNIQIQFNPYQITSELFHRTRTKNFSIQMETQKILNSQSSIEKKNGAGEINLLDSDFTTKLKSSRRYVSGTKIEI